MPQSGPMTLLLFWRRGVAAAIALAVVSWGPPRPVLAASDPQKLAERLAEGERLFDLGLVEEALAAFQEADKLAGGGSALPLLHLSRTHRRLKDHDLAVEYARRALSLAAEPDAQVAAHLELGRGLLGKPGPGTHLDEAEQAVRRAVELSGNKRSPLQATLRMVLERRERELAAAAPPLFVDTKEYVRQFDKARRLVEKGRYSEAVVAYQEANRLAGGVAINALFALAQVYRRLGKHDLAIACVRETVALQPDVTGRVAGYYPLGEELLAKPGQGDHLVEAEQVFRRLLELRSFEDDRARAGLLEALERQGRGAEAEALEVKAEIAAEKAAAAVKEAARLAELQAAARECRARACACNQTDLLAGEGGRFEKPEVRKKRIPEYTPEARAAQLRGVVIVEMIIDERGDTCCPRILKGLPHGLDQATLEAVRQWQFKPASRDGKPVCAYYSMTVTFSTECSSGSATPPACNPVLAPVD